MYIFHGFRVILSGILNFVAFMTELIKNNISFLRRRGISINLASKVLLKNNRLTLEDLKGDTKYQTSYSLIDEKNSGLFKKVMGFCESFVGTGPIGANKFWEYPWVLINMKLEKGLKVLDAGCGKSPIQFALAKLGCETYGIDPFESVSWHGIDRKLPSLYGVKVAYKVEGMEKISYPDNYFDRVCSVSVIEHCRTKDSRGQSAAKDYGQGNVKGAQTRRTVGLDH